MRALLCCVSEDDCKDLVPLLGSLDVGTVAVADCGQAMDLARESDFELILVDVDAGPGWRSAIETFRAQAPAAGVLAYSRLAEERLWLDALDAGAFDFVCKPFCRQDVHWVFENALRARQVAT